MEHLNNEDDTVVGDDNGDNNMTGRVDEVVAPVIENSAPHGRMEIGPSSNSVPTIDSNSVENADSSRRSVHVEQVDTKTPSMTMAMPNNVKKERGKSTIGIRIIEAACCRVERSLLWEITGSLAAAGNDLRVGNQLLFSKPKSNKPSSTVSTQKTRGLLVVSNVEKAYKPRWYLLLAQSPWCVTLQVAQMLLG